MPLQQTSEIRYAAKCLLSMDEELLRQTESGEHGSHLALVEDNPLALASYLESYAIITSPTFKGLRIYFHFYSLESEVDYY